MAKLSRVQFIVLREDLELPLCHPVMSVFRGAAGQLPFPPELVLWGTAALAAVTLVLYVLIDAISYRKIPTLDVPLKAGEAPGRKCSARTCTDGR